MLPKAAEMSAHICTSMHNINNIQVMYQNELYPVTVEATGPNLALFDPHNDRMKA